MHENLYFSPSEGQDTLNWITQLHESVISEARADSKRLAETAEGLGMYRCAAFVSTRVQELLDKCVYEVPQALKKKTGVE